MAPLQNFQAAVAMLKLKLPGPVCVHDAKWQVPRPFETVRARAGAASSTTDSVKGCMAFNGEIAWRHESFDNVYNLLRLL